MIEERLRSRTVQRLVMQMRDVEGCLDARLYECAGRAVVSL
jgi:hypothetical protein